ncbi:MAG TPA: TetR/AcrR family transcriptional regulator, partial [Sphingobium sp.]|uniref:TetR/AcrR family transcriptional regulator n=1 Tax=Sphingobium sp. TaxID=1912891 RepID=UPI002ED5EF6D
MPGLAGGRISRIVKKAGTNPRMLYECFGSKTALYLATLESALAALRAEELTLDVEHLDPLEGLLQLFDFMNGHFERDGYLVSL